MIMKHNPIAKQMPKNLGMNILSFLVNIVLGLWLIPYLINHVGILAYGLIPLAMFFAEYVGIIILALNSAIGRFLLVALQQKNFEEANEIYNTAMVVMSVLGVLQIVFMAWVIYDISFFVNVPEDLKEDAVWLFFFTFAGFLLSLYRAVLTAPLFACNRTDLIQLSTIIQMVSRVIIIVALFTVDQPLLMYVGIANFFASIFSFTLIVFNTRRIVPQLKFNLMMFKKGRVKELTSMGGWVLVHQIGGLLFLKFDLYIINKFIGAYRAGEYAIIIQWNNVVRSMIGVFVGVISPVIMIYYAKNETKKLIEITHYSVKLFGLLLALILGILCALSGDLLSVWIGETYRNLSGLMILSLAPLVINLAVMPIFTINTAFNRVKIPGIVTIVLGIINFFFAIILVKYTSLEIYGVLIAGAILLSLKNVVFTPLYASYILGIGKTTFIEPLWNGVVAFIIIYIITYFAASLIDIETFFDLAIVGGVIMVVSFPVLYYIFMSKEDRTQLLILVPEKIKVKFKQGEHV